MDDEDVLLAALDGLRRPGPGRGGRRQRRRLYLKVPSPTVKALALGLRGNYRSPFNGRSGKDLAVGVGRVRHHQQ